MSLPTKARFYNIYGDFIGACFFNVGWFLTFRGLLQAIDHGFPKQVYTDPRIHYVEIYNQTYFMEFINDIREMDPEEGVKALEMLYNNG